MKKPKRRLPWPFTERGLRSAVTTPFLEGAVDGAWTVLQDALHRQALHGRRAGGGLTVHEAEGKLLDAVDTWQRAKQGMKPVRQRRAWMNPKARSLPCYASSPNNGLEGYGWTYQEWQPSYRAWAFRCVGMCNGERHEESLRRGAIAGAWVGVPCRFLWVERWRRAPGRRGWLPVMAHARIVGPVICESVKKTCPGVRRIRSARKPKRFPLPSCKSKRR